MVASGAKVKSSDINNANTTTWVTGGGTTTSSSAIASGTETVILTAASYTFKANTAYKVNYHGGVSTGGGAGTTNSPLFRVRKTNNVGAQFDVARVAVYASAGSHGFNFNSFFQVGGSDVTAVIVVTLTGPTAATTTTATLSAASSSPAAIDIYRVGQEGSIPAAIAAYAPTLT